MTASLLAACSSGGERNAPDPHIQSLTDISIEALRERTFGSQIAIEKRMGGKPWESYLSSYRSDGLRVYARFDIPRQSLPRQGYPVVILVHGWAGVDAAPAHDFYYGSNSTYSDMIDAYVEAGFVVVTPGWRGHGTVNGVPADGIEFMHAWDNGSYISPIFYAIDVLNLLDSLDSIEQLDLGKVNLVAHSQGGDVALIALAVAGENSAAQIEIAAASIWSGTFPARLTQLETYWPMQKTPEAFMSGDGSWTGSAIGADGSVNPNFVFGYPSDWISTMNRDEWTWQNDVYSVNTVAESLVDKLDQMYYALNTYVADIYDADYSISIEAGAKTIVTHDPKVLAAVETLGAFDKEEFLTEPILLHHSDRDFYSLPDWNADLCQRINQAGGHCIDYQYVGNTHALEISQHSWYSGTHAEPGFNQALQRDIALFRGGGAAER